MRSVQSDEDEQKVLLRIFCGSSSSTYVDRGDSAVEVKVFEVRDTRWDMDNASLMCQMEVGVAGKDDMSKADVTASFCLSWRKLPPI